MTFDFRIPADQPHAGEHDGPVDDQQLEPELVAVEQFPGKIAEQEGEDGGKDGRRFLII